MFFAFLGQVIFDMTISFATFLGQGPFYSFDPYGGMWWENMASLGMGTSIDKRERKRLSYLTSNLYVSQR